VKKVDATAVVTRRQVVDERRRADSSRQIASFV
jgi:hypothetical protein